MRLSLLLAREPFAAIAEKTLADFWSQHFGREITVHWADGRPLDGPDEQVWLVNAYLNAIFVPEAEAAVFDPVRREFGRSLVWWKRPLQRSYVQLASTRPTARLLAQAYLRVSPALPQAAGQLVVAGNHKIRWLNAGEGTAYGIRKAGFHGQFMRQEIEARQQAVACGVPVPALLAVDEAGGWFAEQYVSGTPVNRLADRNAAVTAVEEAMTALSHLYDATEIELTLGDYAAQLHARILALIQGHHLLSDALRLTLGQLADRLWQQVGGSLAAWPLALTHGDFQAANILLNERGVWLIDWEYAQVRQRGYDCLVFALQARSPAGLGQRLAAFVAQGWPEPWAQLWQPAAARRETAVLFLLEELELHLSQINQPPLTQPGSGLAAWSGACSEWLGSQKEESFERA